MTDFLYSIDLAVFYFINHTIANPAMDRFFVFITDVNHWYIAYLILLGIAFIKGGRIGKISAVGALLLIVTSDQLSSFFIKHWVARVRPCNALSDCRSLIEASGSYSFPSSHAVNNFAAAAFFYRIYPDLKWVLFITAALVAISRVYVGRHYPSDIAGGALIGSLLGYLFASIALRLDSYIKERYNKTITEEVK
ncbi:MAG: phosphatase PAP2 family protein [Ignavibacteria bacterium]|jgi:undecaprenyl-diphosphatase|nr:phosphatase PAP2 family protein [Ignavibacteria bacterium]MCU7501991.1 phosphatase PAP2 family protein [Ignavibacteria bacterium]MCU7516959.1 phosphatase PAP2 family protein [Ignavibacteria bacterium]